MSVTAYVNRVRTLFDVFPIVKNEILQLSQAFIERRYVYRCRYAPRAMLHIA